jgi:hypothetical protein
MTLLAATQPPCVIRTGPQQWKKHSDIRLETYAAYRNHLLQTREAEWREMQEYLAHNGCLMRYLLDRLESPEAAIPCGYCTWCCKRLILPVEIDSTIALTASGNAFGAEPVKLQSRHKIPDRSMPRSGLSGEIPRDYRFKTGRALVRWGDASLAKAIATGKQNSHFDEEIITAAVRLIQTTW